MHTNIHTMEIFSSVQFSHSVVSDSLQPHESQHARPPCPSPTPKLMSIESVMPSSHLVLCRPLLLLPPIAPSIRVFSNESTFVQNCREVPQNLKIELPYDLTISFLDIYSKELKSVSQRGNYNLMFIVALFTTTKMWKQSRCPLTDK